MVDALGNVEYYKPLGTYYQTYYGQLKYNITTTRKEVGSSQLVNWGTVQDKTDRTM